MLFYPRNFKRNRSKTNHTSLTPIPHSFYYFLIRIARSPSISMEDEEERKRLERLLSEEDDEEEISFQPAKSTGAGRRVDEVNTAEIDGLLKDFEATISLAEQAVTKSPGSISPLKGSTYVHDSSLGNFEQGASSSVPPRGMIELDGLDLGIDDPTSFQPQSSPSKSFSQFLPSAFISRPEASPPSRSSLLDVGEEENPASAAPTILNPAPANQKKDPGRDRSGSTSGNSVLAFFSKLPVASMSSAATISSTEEHSEERVRTGSQFNLTDVINPTKIKEATSSALRDSISFAVSKAADIGESFNNFQMGVPTEPRASSFPSEDFTEVPDISGISLWAYLSQPQPLRTIEVKIRPDVTRDTIFDLFDTIILSHGLVVKEKTENEVIAERKSSGTWHTVILRIGVTVEKVRVLLIQFLSDSTIKSLPEKITSVGSVPATPSVTLAGTHLVEVLSGALVEGQTTFGTLPNDEVRQV